MKPTLVPVNPEHRALNQNDRTLNEERQRQRRALGIGQGVFYIVTGLWPLVSMRTFEKVTGPKKDEWLVKTVGLLIAVGGATLLRSSLKPRPSQDAALNAAGQALTLGSVSLYYSLKGRISKVYLMDAAVEYILVLAWIVTLQAESKVSQ